MAQVWAIVLGDRHIIILQVLCPIEVLSRSTLAISSEAWQLSPPCPRTVLSVILVHNSLDSSSFNTFFLCFKLREPVIVSLIQHLHVPLYMNIQPSACGKYYFPSRIHGEPKGETKKGTRKHRNLIRLGVWFFERKSIKSLFAAIVFGFHGIPLLVIDGTL